MMGFTLAICTYNRARLLQRALESLANCQSPKGPWELLIVDNNSTDGTREVVDGFSGRLPIRRCFEAEQGLSAARNRAIAECGTDVLLFTDDDLRFDPSWLRSYEAAFKLNPEVGWFGGRIRPWWEHAKPGWLVDDRLPLISGLLVHYDLGVENRYFVPTDPSPFGASFAIRRSLLARFGGFRLDLGVKGSVPGRGEEAEYVERLRAAGIPGWYVGECSARHWQDPERFRLRYLYHYGIQKGLAERLLVERDHGSGRLFAQECLFLAKALVQWARGRGDRARQCVINMGIQRGLRTMRNA